MEKFSDYIFRLCMLIGLLICASIGISGAWSLSLVKIFHAPALTFESTFCILVIMYWLKLILTFKLDEK